MSTADPEDPASDFEKAGQEPQPGLLKEILLMLRENKKYWMIPLLVLLFGLGLLVLINPASPAAPFIYTFF